MIGLLRRTAYWIADHSIEDNGLGYCAAVEDDGIPCGRPAMATGTDNNTGNTVEVCPIHDWTITP